jgi:hypothetical protein
VEHDDHLDILGWSLSPSAYTNLAIRDAPALTPIFSLPKTWKWMSCGCSYCRTACPQSSSWGYCRIVKAAGSQGNATGYMLSVPNVHLNLHSSNEIRSIDSLLRAEMNADVQCPDLQRSKGCILPTAQDPADRRISELNTIIPGSVRGDGRIGT